MLGHTCAWAVTSLDRDAFRALTAFLGTTARLTGSIARHQLEVALRDTSQDTNCDLHLIRRQVVDASDAEARAHPVLATVSRGYVVTPKPGCTAAQQATAEQLIDAFAAARRHVHSTDVAEVVKRYVRDRLAAFPLRAHGGVYFVSAKREDELFRLKAYLEEHAIGGITHIRVIGNDHEIKLLTEEIHHMVTSRIAKLQEAIAETDPADQKRVARMGTRVSALRRELATMQELFAFAADTIEEKDRTARTMIRDLFTREMHQHAPLFAGAAAGAGGDGCPGTCPPVPAASQTAAP